MIEVSQSELVQIISNYRTNQSPSNSPSELIKLDNLIMNTINEITSTVSKSTAAENTREAWLLNAVEKLKPLFKKQGYDVPKVQVSCGFTSSGKNRHAGECWSTTSTEAVINKYTSALNMMMQLR